MFFLDRKVNTLWKRRGTREQSLRGDVGKPGRQFNSSTCVARPALCLMFINESIYLTHTHNHVRTKGKMCIGVHAYSHCSSARSAERGWHCWASEHAWILSPTSPTHTHKTRQRRLLRHKQTLLRGIHERYKQPHYNKSGHLCVCVPLQVGDRIKQRTQMIMSLHKVQSGERQVVESRRERKKSEKNRTAEKEERGRGSSETDRVEEVKKSWRGDKKTRWEWKFD